MFSTVKNSIATRVCEPHSTKEHISQLVYIYYFYMHFFIKFFITTILLFFSTLVL